MSIPAQVPIATVLRQHPLLARCSSIELARLLAGTTQCEYPAGAEVFKAGSTAAHYYWIVSGEVELVSADDTWRVGADEVFGAEAFADAHRHLVSARAATPMTALRITRSAVLALTGDHPDLKSAALLDLAARMGRVTPPASMPITIKTAAPMPTKQRIGWAATLLLPPLACIAADYAGLPQHNAIYAGLFTMTAVMWLFAVVDEFIPPLIALVAMLFIELVPAHVALAGFSSRTFFLLLGVYALSAVLLSSGLA
jgi:DASS family divalent anion:Na+ symporter